MTSHPRSSDLGSPLPTGQFRGFLLLFHAMVILLIGVILYTHWKNASSQPNRSLLLTCLVAVHLLLYVWFFAFPSLRGGPRVTRAWWFSFVAAVLIILVESRIEPRLSWTIITYVALISVFPLRISLPVAAAMLLALAFVLKHVDPIFLVFQLGSWVALAFFLGRLVMTSVERGQLVLELQKAKLELEQARQADAELAVLRERERFARDLHDNLGHSLVTLTVQLEAAQRLVDSDPPRASALIEEMQKLTRASMEDLRRSISNLRAPGLGDRPLAQAVQTLCTNSSKCCGIPIECNLNANASSLPPALAEALWRLVQESLTNIEKHAAARHVHVNLTEGSREVVLRVQDDGVGLPHNAEEKPGHFGLRGLRERVEGLGGTLTLNSNGRGTLLEARLPLIA